MSVIKVKGIEHDFTIVPNKTINDNLSWQALGLLTYLGSKPEDWQVSVKQLTNYSKNTMKSCGRDATYSIIKELESKGYIRKTLGKEKSGKFSGYDYEVSFNQFPENPETVPFTDSPYTANPTQQSKEINKEKKKDISAFENAPEPTPEKHAIKYQDIVDSYHELIPRMPKVRVLTDKRKRMIKLFIDKRRKESDSGDYGIENVRNYFKYISSRCTWMLEKRPDGKGGFWREKNFDYIFKEDCYIAVLEDRHNDIKG